MKRLARSQRPATASARKIARSGDRENKAPGRVEVGFKTLLSQNQMSKRGGEKNAPKKVKNGKADRVDKMIQKMRMRWEITGRKLLNRPFQTIFSLFFIPQCPPISQGPTCKKKKMPILTRTHHLLLASRASRTPNCFVPWTVNTKDGWVLQMSNICSRCALGVSGHDQPQTHPCMWPANKNTCDKNFMQSINQWAYL